MRAKAEKNPKTFTTDIAIAFVMIVIMHFPSL